MHAGTTGRPRIFVLGLDADRTSGAPGPDPILDEEMRRALGSPALPTTGERIAQQRWALARALATLRGRITLSCAMSGDLSERAIGPSPALLQAHRILEASPGADYDALRDALGAPACAVPSRSSGVLDLRDAWLSALTDGKRLLDGSDAVCLGHAGLAAGLSARASRIGTALSAHHGLVPAAAGAFDPRKSKRAISPSSLEELAKCPLSWFYRRGLGLRLPEEPAYDPAQWLDARQRGSLLHEVFEAFVRELMPHQELVGTDDARNALERIVEDALARWRTAVPPPSESVLESEGAEIREAARAFLAMEEEWLPRTGARWHVPELAFGPRAPAWFALPDGSRIPIHGRIDRVDQLPGGGLVVIDFKTGSATVHRKSPKQGAFNGGRSLQAPIYAVAAATVLEGTVVAFEYRFPTVKGENTRVVYGQDEIALAGPVVQQLLDHVVTGHFLPTLDKADCSFCDCQPICRVRLDKEDRLTLSPRAAWAKANAAGLPAYAAMLARRGVRQ
jgi:ATP-dependent helicase/nuclease subunit B